MCLSSVNGAWPIHGTPSPPIWVKVDRRAVHPDRHVVAADAGDRARAFGHLGRGVVRAAGAEARRARDRRGAGAAQRRFLGLEDVRRASMSAAHARSPRLAEAPGDARGDHRRGRAGRRRRAAAIRCRMHSPHFACSSNLPSTLRAHVGAPVVELFLQLVLDDLALLLDDQDLLQARGELARDVASSGQTTSTLCRRMPTSAAVLRRRGPGRPAPGACRCRPCPWR